MAGKVLKGWMTRRLWRERRDIGEVCTRDERKHDGERGGWWRGGVAVEV